MNRFSSVFSAINRDNDKPLRIISFSTHEGFQLSMAKCNAQYIMIDGPEGKKWDEDYREKPNNIIEITNDKLEEKIDYCDLIVSHTIPQREMAKQLSDTFNIPHINLLHTYPDINLPKRTINNIKNSNNCTKQVFTTEDQRDEWGYSGEDSIVINHGIDTKLFNGWNGENKKVLTVANNYRERGNELGFDLYQHIRRDIEVGNNQNLFTHIGKSTDGFSEAAKSLDDLVEAYKTNHIFLNTCYRSVIPTTMLEAMSVGMPIVSTENPTIKWIIKNGENGFVSNDKNELIQRIVDILNNEELAKKLSLGARKTICDNYNLDKFVLSWNNLFNDCVIK